MGACVSRPGSSTVGGGGKVEGVRCKTKRMMRRRKKKNGLRKRVPSHLSDRPASDGAGSLPVDRQFNNPAYQGGVEEAWYDSTAILESDWSDEDFQSLPDDVISMSGIDSTSGANSARHSLSEAVRNSIDARGKSEGPSGEKKHVDQVSGEYCGGEGSLLDNCGILSNNCLPCLASTVPNVEKRRSLSASPPHMRKKAALKLSFKWKEGNPAAAFLSSKALLQRPIAGSQVPFCPMGKRVPDTWSDIGPGTFKVRGENYLRDKKKEFASDSAAYIPFGLDVFLSQKKINHIARFVELPAVDSSGKLPPILVVNAQVPLYPAALFQGESDGEGISFVLYFKLNDRYAKELPDHFQESVRKLIDDETEKVKGFRAETAVPFRERLKILGRVANVDDLPMNSAERKLMHTYNEKPVLSRPQHDFYEGENYFEIDLDMHRFSYISRKGFATFIDRLKLCILDFGLTIQGNKAEELPEQILCCIRLNEIDYSNYQQLDENLE